MSPAPIPVEQLDSVLSWGDHLGVRRGFVHLARHGADRTLCGIAFPEASRSRPVGHCGTCNWIRQGCP